MNGEVYFPSTIAGSGANYTCNLGFDLQPGAQGIRTCEEDGVWSGSAPMCVRQEDAMYELRVMLHDYCNPGSMLANGDICDEEVDDFESQCDSRFTFCLRDFTSSQECDPTTCPFQNARESETFFNQYCIDFRNIDSLNTRLANPLSYTGSRWPATVSSS